jgi:lipoprotein-anchoring transpeptidase ErfK/SrfK
VLRHAETRPKTTHSTKDPRPRLEVPLHWWLWAGVVLVGALLLVLGALAIYAQIRILPGVRVLGVALDGQTRAQAADVLRDDWRGRTILLSDGEGTWSVAPAALGLTLDEEATIRAAFERGRSLDQIGARFRGRQTLDVVPVSQFDPAAARATLQAMRPRIDRAPVDSGVRFVDGRAEAVQPQPGRSLDLAATVYGLEQHRLEVISAGRLDLIARPVPPIVSDVSALVERANQWLVRTLSVQVYDPILNQPMDWSFAPDEWGDWVSLDVDPSSPDGLSWTFDADAAAAALTERSASLEPDRYVHLDRGVAAIEAAINDQSSALRLRAYHRPGRHTVRLGDTIASISREVGIPYPWILQANPGVGDSLREGQVLTIPSPDVLLPLPVVEHKRIVISIGRQRMWAYQDGSLRWEWVVSTGIESSPTAPGVFQIQSHDPNAYAASWDLWMPYFMGIYRPVPTSDFMNGFHGFPTRDGANLLWTGSLGYPVTYGCILLDTQNAALLYEWAEPGVVVEIQP